MDKVLLEDNLCGRSLTTKVIPTVCNLKNMLDHLQENGWDETKLKQWEKRSFKAYNIAQIKARLIVCEPYEWTEIIRLHILQTPVSNLGASAIDIYLIAYLTQRYGNDKTTIFDAMKEMGISDATNSFQAIWQVGKGDGFYLHILDESGMVKDWKFMQKWIRR